MTTVMNRKMQLHCDGRNGISPCAVKWTFSVNRIDGAKHAFVLSGRYAQSFVIRRRRKSNDRLPVLYIIGI